MRQGIVRIRANQAQYNPGLTMMLDSLDIEWEYLGDDKIQWEDGMALATLPEFLMLGFMMVVRTVMFVAKPQLFEEYTRTVKGDLQ